MCVLHRTCVDKSSSVAHIVHAQYLFVGASIDLLRSQWMDRGIDRWILNDDLQVKKSEQTSAQDMTRKKCQRKELLRPVVSNDAASFFGQSLNRSIVMHGYEDDDFYPIFEHTHT